MQRNEREQQRQGLLKEGRRTDCVTITAVSVYLCRLFLVVRLLCAGLVFMLVMTVMGGHRIDFVLTIGCCRCPRKLERQHHQHQNNQQFFHGLNHSIEYENVRKVRFFRSHATGANHWQRQSGWRPCRQIRPSIRSPPLSMPAPEIQP